MGTAVLHDCIVNYCKVGIFVRGTGGGEKIHFFLRAVLDEVVDFNVGLVLMGSAIFRVTCVLGLLCFLRPHGPYSIGHASCLMETVWSHPLLVGVSGTVAPT